MNIIREDVVSPASESADLKRRRVVLGAKRSVQFLFAILIVPRLAVYKIASLLWGRERALTGASESIGRIPGMRGVYSRQAFYRFTLDLCGKDIYFGWGSIFSKTSSTVGNGVYIGRRCGIGLADLGDEVMLADGVQILSGAHQHGEAPDVGQSHRRQNQRYERVVIGRGAWVGTNAVVMADIGEGAIVGAGAVVNRPIPAWTVAAGVPAGVVRDLGTRSGAVQT